MIKQHHGKLLLHTQIKQLSTVIMIYFINKLSMIWPMSGYFLYPVSGWILDIEIGQSMQPDMQCISNCDILTVRGGKCQIVLFVVQAMMYLTGRRHFLNSTTPSQSQILTQPGHSLVNSCTVSSPIQFCCYLYNNFCVSGSSQNRSRFTTLV